MRKKTVLFLLCVLLVQMSMFYRVSTAIISQELIEDLKLNPQSLGFLGAAFFYSFALLQIPLGLTLDRAGPKRTMIFLNIVAIIGTTIFAWSSSLAVAVLGRTLMGLGMAANFMGSLKLLSNWFDSRKFATLSGLLLSLGTLGCLVATSPLALLVESVTWRTSFRILAGVNTCLVIWLLAFVQDSPAVKEAPGVILARGGGTKVSALESIGRLFTDPSYWAISLSFFLRYGSFVSLQALWIGPFLIKYAGIPVVTAGNLLLLMSVGFIFGAPVGGVLSDRLFKSRKLAVMIGLLMAGVFYLTLAILVGNSLILPVLGGLLLGIGFFNSFGQVSFAHIKELMPVEMAGFSMSAINFFSMMGGGVFIHGLGGVVGLVSGRNSEVGEGYHVAFLVCFLAVVCALILYMKTRDSHGQYHKMGSGDELLR